MLSDSCFSLTTSHKRKVCVICLKETWKTDQQLCELMWCGSTTADKNYTQGQCLAHIRTETVKLQLYAPRSTYITDALHWLSAVKGHLLNRSDTADSAGRSHSLL